ncbi:hypothetical protein PRIPAC_72637, partial [Pristionchus pacificus]|uniref:Uncharacterized protein n=1 Tax=Pristionchus pacificus TaxID=54126 RepID=A0A2A6CRZ2_PRIPA
NLFEDFIPGGKYSGAVDDVVVDHTRCASATNRFIESAFGFVDRLSNHSPHMRIYRREARLLIAKNHTMAWLSSKSSEERLAIVWAARASITILQKSLEKEKGYNAKVALQIKRRNQAVQAISPFGFITTVNRLTAFLHSSPESGTGTAAATTGGLSRKIDIPWVFLFIYRFRALGKEAAGGGAQDSSSSLKPIRRVSTILTSSVDHPLTGRSIRRWTEEA